MRKRLVLPGGFYIAEQGRGRYLLLRRTGPASFEQVGGTYPDRWKAVQAAYRAAALAREEPLQQPQSPQQQHTKEETPA